MLKVGSPGGGQNVDGLSAGLQTADVSEGFSIIARAGTNNNVTDY